MALDGRGHLLISTGLRIVQIDLPAGPTTYAADVRVAEGTLTPADPATTSVSFRVALLAPATQTVTVDYRTADGSAHAGLDYTATSGTLTFQPGETSKTLAVTVLSDRQAEPDETFSLLLTNVSETAALGDPSATATIIDEDRDLAVRSSTPGNVPPMG